MATRDDVRVPWVDVARGDFQVPRNRPARLFLERAKVGYIEFPVVDPFFHDTGAVVLPEGTVPAMTKAFAFIRDNPGHVALTLGHCQSKSTQAKVMTQRRAEGNRALMEGAPWARHALTDHSVADLQQALTWVAATRGTSAIQARSVTLLPDPQPGRSKSTGRPPSTKSASRRVSAPWRTCSTGTQSDS